MNHGKMALKEQSWPESGLEDVKQCPICRTQDRDLLYDNLWDSVFRCSPGTWSLWRCRSCQSAFLDPRPDEATISLAYANYYTHAPARQRDTMLSLASRVRRSLANGYRNHRYHAGLRPANKLGAILFGMSPALRQAIDLPLRYLPARTSDRCYRVLDVGCGSGDFLDAAASIGWHVAGCDPDPAVAANVGRHDGPAREIRVGGIEAWAGREGAFDAITFSHVIEHVHDPVGTIQRAFELLAPGGMLYLETPNIDALGRATYGSNWRGLEPPRHLVLFTWNALHQVLTNAGFARIKRLPRIGVFDGLARQSIRLSRGLDPLGEAPAARDEPGFFLKLKARFMQERSEFVTLVAYKPPRSRE